MVIQSRYLTPRKLNRRKGGTEESPRQIRKAMDVQIVNNATRTGVLLVEDDLAISKLMAKVLDDAGYRSLTIANHKEIGVAIDRFSPSCVILDGEIGRDGRLRSWADAAAIRRAHPALPVLMFSADADALAEERAGTSRRSREASFVGIVSKPFMIDELLATLQRVLDAPPNTGNAAALVSEATAVSATEWEKADRFSEVIHELNTPLAAISGQMQLARRVMSKDPARGRAAMNAALQQIQRMTMLIASLQKDLHVEANQLSLDIVTFDLCEAVSEAIRRNEHEDTSRFRLDRPAEAILVSGDPDRIAQILDNLLNNALKYSPSGTPVDIAVSTLNSEAQVRVEDYGIGVAAEERDRMFAAYYRTPRSRAIPGLGLGLHISRRLAEQHGGRLWLDDSTDAGSVFALALPLAH
jgi:signal transduction histidine kinase